MRARIVGLLAVVCAALVGAPAVAWAYPDDTYYKNEAWLSKIHWRADQLVPANAYPTIAFVDSGIMDGFGEFAGYITPDSADCTSGSPVSASTGATVDDVVRPVPHGTQVASLAAAPINGVGIVGVSPFSPVVAVRVTKDPSLQVGPVQCALRYLAGLAQSEPLVVNLSLQFGHTDGAKLSAAIQRLVGDRALLVAATGNRGTGPGTSGVQWPAHLPHVLAVGDTERRQLLPGPQLDVLAPGANLFLPLSNGTWATFPGSETSYSTALVSGAAAAVWGAMPDVSNPQVVAYILRRSGDYQHWSKSRGFGTINLAAALKLATQHPPPDDEFEPNDDPHHPFKWSGKTLHGIVTKTDDPADVWRLTRIRRCVAPRSVRGKVKVSCVKAKGGVRVTVRPRKPNVAYTIVY